MLFFILYSQIVFSNSSFLYFLFYIKTILILKKKSKTRPYSHIEKVQVAIGVGDGSLKLQLPRQKMIPQLYDICSKCLEYEAEDRPTFQKIVKQKKNHFHFFIQLDF